MVLWKNVHLATTLLLVYNSIIIYADDDDVENLCVGKPENWTAKKTCSTGISNCYYSTCDTCNECQRQYPEYAPVFAYLDCGPNMKYYYGYTDCPVSQCIYCLACNTSDLQLLNTGTPSTSIGGCKGCYFGDTIAMSMGSEWSGDLGACRVRVACEEQRSGNNKDQMTYFKPVLKEIPVCSQISSDTPELNSVDPERGPVAGGTILTITGNGLKNIARVAVGEAMARCIEPSFQNSNVAILFCQVSTARTPSPGKVTLKGQTNVWPVTWVNSNATFEFRPNPRVTNVTEASIIAAGGIQVIFKGLNLGSSKSPKLLVSAICDATKMVVRNFTMEECQSSDNETVLYCNTPNVGNVTGTDACSLSNNTETPGSFSSSYRGFKFMMGLKFDGYLRYLSLPALARFGEQGYLQVNDNVTIYPFTEDELVKEVDPSSNNVLIIRGDNMDRGARMIDYKIYLGKNSSCVVLALLSTQISCRLPDVAPPIDHSHSFVYKGQDTVSVRVSVGNLQVYVGYIYYAPSLLPTILLATLLPGAAIIVAVVAISLCIKRCKRKNSAETSAGTVQTGRQSFNLYSVIRDRQGQLSTTVRELPERLSQELASYIVSRSNITLKEFLSQGQFGKIYRAVLQDNKVVAAKLLKDGSANVDAVAKFLEEAVLMKDFRHANVLGLCGVVLDIAQPIVLVELMEAGDLRTVIKRQSFPLGDLVNFCTQIANGMVYLSALKFIHRDLAARNCLVDQSYRVKIGDFGLSHDLDAKDYYRGKDHTKPLPVKWMAPESLENGLFSTASDAWSYGVVMWEIMAKGRVPYADVNNYEMKRYLLSGRRLDCPTDTPVTLYQIMKLCWNAAPSKRPTFVRLLLLIDEFITGESERRNMERCYTKNIHQETYNNATNEQAAQSNDYLEVLAIS